MTTTISGRHDLLVTNVREIEKTALYTLWCRAVDSGSDPSVLNDPIASAILDKLNFPGLSRFATSAGRAGVVPVCLRSLLFDDRVEAFIKASSDTVKFRNSKAHASPQSVVVELGCGLNTRMERLGNKTGHLSIEVDLPVMAALRKRFLPTSERRTVLSASLLTDDWAAQITRGFGSQPKLFVLEGVSFYLTEVQMQFLVQTIAKHFPGSWLLFDSLSSFWQRHEADDPMRNLFEAPYKWFVDDVSRLESWSAGIEVIDSSTWRDVDGVRRDHIERAYPHALGCEEVANAYRINVLRLGS
jgi:O-methyltransferase involved in polyketide biosynthesis